MRRVMLIELYSNSEEELEGTLNAIHGTINLRESMADENIDCKTYTEISSIKERANKISEQEKE